MLKKEKINIIYSKTEILILNEGIRRFNITNLCKEIMLSKKTFYKEFNSKELFLEKFYMNMMRKSYMQIIEIIQKNDSFFEKFNNISNIVQSRLPFFNNFSLDELVIKYPIIGQKIYQFKDTKILPLLTLLIKDAQKHNIVNNFEPKMMLQVFFAATSFIYKDRKSELDEKVNFKNIFEILLKGILTKRGKNFLNHKLVSIN